ncbi:MAG: DUF5689 domain-containing protein [Bacteroidales bacterium]|nr:DUF5689 domain-containing protein [Bacteroidales bacterium]MDY6347562.1 DUF5689 domain-containing protein [Bacteroidales bacterium]
MNHKCKRNARLLQLLAFLAVVGVMTHGCNTDQDVAPVPTFDGEANMTISELVALHEIGSEDSYDTIPAGTVISGIVTTSDEWGNNYKYINIEDETGGIQIKINNTALYNRYKVGQKVFVKCDGLHIGDYRRLPQMGVWVNGSMEAIPSAKTYLHIFTDGMPGPVEPSIVMTSIPSASSIPAGHYNRLVRLEGATFVEGGMATFSDAAAATSHDIKMQDGTTITMRTSNYAKFASTLLPVGTGNVTGILTRYNSTVQIVISSLNDLENFSVPQTLQTIFSVNYHNAFNEGWAQYGFGNDWNILSNSSFNGFFINPSDDQDKWLVSPAIDLGSAKSPELSFSSRAPKGLDIGQCRAYYTADFTGDVSTTVWTEIDMSEFAGQTGQSNVTVPLPESVAGSGFRIAFRHSGDISAWYLSKITIKAYK